ncbi:MAG: hypothetical protein JKY25_10515 [Robiginitomaculum sp.]|nr:hypothetical protein [Robiginitomaculum sp.]
MAYLITNPPTLLIDRVGGIASSLWGYNSPDAIADILAADYVTDAVDLGLRVGDFVQVYDSVLNLSHSMHISALSAGGAATLVASTN